MEQKCPICLNAAKVMLVPCDSNLATQIECPRCGGPFLVQNHLNDIMLGGHYHADYKAVFTPRKRSIASSLLRQQENYFILNDENKAYFCEARDLSMFEKIDNILRFIEKKVFSGDGFQRCVEIHPDDLSLHAQCWAMNTYELDALFMLLGEVNFLEYEEVEGIGHATITAKGWERLEQLRTPNKDSAQGFVAMWFAPEMTNIYENVLAPAIQSAGYIPHRVDQREHIDKIDDEIILQIRRSRFVVADATGHRGGVYYEAGFASGLGLPVFWTCRKDVMKDLHFDVNHYNCIVWELDKLDEFRDALARRIESVLGRGPRPTT